MNEINGRVAVFWLVVAIILLLFYSCKTKYIPVETKVTETIELHDTTVVKELVQYHDSVSIADTVSYLYNEYAFSYAKWSNGALSHSLGIWPDAVLIVKIPQYMTKTRTVEVPKVVEVEKALSRWQRYKMDFGEISLIANVILISMIIVRWIKKKGGR